MLDKTKYPKTVGYRIVEFVNGTFEVRRIVKRSLFQWRSEVVARVMTMKEAEDILLGTVRAERPQKVVRTLDYTANGMREYGW